MSKIQRPYFNHLAPKLIPLILAGNEGAISEGRRRTNAKVLAAVRKATAPKATAPKVDQAQVTLRKQAWTMRQNSRGTSHALTYAQACEKLGTTPARKAA
jgi:hypothetical protein